MISTGGRGSISHVARRALLSRLSHYVEMGFRVMGLGKSELGKLVMMGIGRVVMAVPLIANRLRQGTFAKNGVSPAKSFVGTVLLTTPIKSAKMIMDSQLYTVRSATLASSTQTKATIAITLALPSAKLDLFGTA